MDKTADAKQIAINFVKTCVNYGIPLSEAYLFGSWAKGTATANSDIDLAIVASSFGRNIIENSRQTALINYEFSDVEVHHFSPNDFNSDDPFINEIKRTGLKIL